MNMCYNHVCVHVYVGGLNSPEPPPPDSSPSVSVDHKQLPTQVKDAYLIFQVQPKKCSVLQTTCPRVSVTVNWEI